MTVCDVFDATVASESDALKEKLLKRADRPLAILASSDWSDVSDIIRPARTESPVVSVTRAPPAGRPATPVTDLFDDLTETDGGDLRRVGGKGLCSSAYDLHKTGLTSTAAFRRRFLRSRSHENLLRVDVRASPSDTKDHPTTATPKLFTGRSPLLPTCVQRPREEPEEERSADYLSPSLNLAIRSSGAMILQSFGINVAPPSAANKARKSRSVDS